MSIEKQKKLKLKRRLDEALYDELLNNFLRGKYTELYEFSTADIAEEYDISMTPVTLTLKRMYNERLIDRTRAGKYIVPLCKAGEVMQLCDVRLMFEQKCLSKVIEEKNHNTMRLITDEADTCERLLHEGDLVGSIRSDLDLHKTIIESYGNMYISMLYKLIRNKLISWNYIYNFNLKMQEEAIEEHGELIKAMEAGDISLAENILENHVNCVRNRILFCIKNRSSINDYENDLIVKDTQSKLLSGMPYSI